MTDDTEACPHCPDGQPTVIHVARSNGAHVAESDAQWIRERLNDKTGQALR